MAELCRNSSKGTALALARNKGQQSVDDCDHLRDYLCDLAFGHDSPHEFHRPDCVISWPNFSTS